MILSDYSQMCGLYSRRAIAMKILGKKLVVKNMKIEKIQ